MNIGNIIVVLMLVGYSRDVRFFSLVGDVFCYFILNLVDKEILLWRLGKRYKFRS